MSEPTPDQLAEVRRRIDHRWRTTAQPGRWIGPALFLLLLTVAGPHPDSEAPSFLSSSAAAATVRPAPAPTLPSPPPTLSVLAPEPQTGGSSATKLPTASLTPSLPTHPATRLPTRRTTQASDGEAERHVADGETALLASALQRLHRDHDASGALLLLETYPQRFPRGQLAGEVAIVEAEALLKLGRREELVERLDPTVVGQLPRASELSLLRAEALAKLGRCPEALAAFSALLEVPLEPSARERALYGRALCRGAVGRTQGAREDLARLLVEFPSEKPKITRALESLEP